MTPTPELWNSHLRKTLESYDETLLRLVSGQLCKPRNQWPPAELIERNLATLENPPVLDRRLKDQPNWARVALALIAHSRQPRFRMSILLEMLHLLGDEDALATLRALLQAGLIYPMLFPLGADNPKVQVHDFDQWLTTASSPEIFVYPPVLSRCLPFALPGPTEAMSVALSGTPMEADGLEWPLRLAVIWQQLRATPLRRTQQGDFFKRDLDRLRADSLVASSPSDGLVEIPDAGLLAVALGLAVELAMEEEGEIRAQSFPEAWNKNLPNLLANLWAAFPHLESWNASQGWGIATTPGNPYPAAYLLSLILLGGLPEGSWAHVDVLEAWLIERHPYWDGATRKNARLGLAPFLLGVAYPMRLLQACKNPDGGFCVRLSTLGKWVLGFSDTEIAIPTFQQTLLVQPNLEILAYRQGLTPTLIVKLTRLANWKSLGAACTLLLEPESVYRALESGETYTSILQTLDRYGMKTTPTPVLDSLRTWSNKRERLTIYPAGALFEFANAADLNDALSRGLPGVRLTDRLAVVATESQIDYRHFRLTGTRDYLLPPEKCVDVEADGVTLSIDLARSDLLLDTEVQRFSEPIPNPANPGRRLYRITPASMNVAKQKGLTPQGLETWFQNRTGLPTSPAARLLLTGAERLPMELRRQIVLHVPAEELADGLEQWPTTRDLIYQRLGPTTLGILEKDVAELREKLKSLEIRTLFEDS